MFQQLNKWLAPNADESELREICLEYDKADIAVATENFSARRRLGKGNFGSVYKGTSRDGHEVAIKVLDVGDDDSLSGFAAEVKVLSKFRHPNLVTLMGWGTGPGQRFLVYELLEGGDVAVKLHQCKTLDGRNFDWAERLWVGLDAACGLSHMHNSTPKAFHRDIKSANILLHRDGTAKMADFGLSGIAQVRGKTTMTCQQISGTPGYVCPNYVQSGRVTEETEMYSYGQVLLELLLNLPPASFGYDGDIVFPINMAVMPEAPGALERSMAALDVKASWPPLLAREVADLALRCSDRDEGRRPQFADVALSLRQLCDTHCSGQRLRQIGTGPDLPELAEVVLECTHSSGVDAASLFAKHRCLVLRAADGPWTVGRMQQPDFFARLVPDESQRTVISRNHLLFTWAAPSLRLKKLSQSVVLVNGAPAPQSEINVIHGTKVDFCGRDGITSFLTFVILIRDARAVAMLGPTPLPTRPDVPAIAPAQHHQKHRQSLHVPQGGLAPQLQQIGRDAQVEADTQVSTASPKHRTSQLSPACIHHPSANDKRASHGACRAASEQMASNRPQADQVNRMLPATQDAMLCALGSKRVPYFWLTLCGTAVKEGFPCDAGRLEGREDGLSVGRGHQKELHAQAFDEDLQQYFSHNHFRIDRGSDGSCQLVPMSKHPIWRNRCGNTTEAIVGDPPLTLDYGDAIQLFTGASDCAGTGPGKIRSLFWVLQDALSDKQLTADEIAILEGKPLNSVVLETSTSDHGRDVTDFTFDPRIQASGVGRDACNAASVTGGCATSENKPCVGARQVEAEQPHGGDHVSNVAHQPLPHVPMSGDMSTGEYEISSTLQMPFAGSVGAESSSIHSHARSGSSSLAKGKRARVRGALRSLVDDFLEPRFGVSDLDIGVRDEDDFSAK